MCSTSSHLDSDYDPEGVHLSRLRQGLGFRVWCVFFSLGGGGGAGCKVCHCRCVGLGCGECHGAEALYSPCAAMLTSPPIEGIRLGQVASAELKPVWCGIRSSLRTAA